MHLNKVLSSLFFMILFFALSFLNAQVKNDTIIASTFFKQADSLLREGQYKNAIQLYQKAIPEYQKANVWEKAASCYNKIANTQKLTSDFESSLKNANKALEISNQHLPANNRQKAYAYDNIGHYYEQSVSDFKKAEEYFKQAIEIRRKIYPENHPDIALSYDKFGVLNHRQGYIEKALEYYQKSLVIRIETLGEDHVTTGSSFGRIAKVYRRQGKYQQAIEYYQKELKNDEKEYGKNHLRTAFGHNSLGVTYNYLSNHEKAEFHLKKSLDIKLKSGTENQENIAHSHYGLGNFYKDIGKYKLAEYHYTTALKCYIKLFGTNSINVANGYYGFNLLYGNIGLFDLSIDYLQKALDIYLSKEENHPNIAKIYNSIGTKYQDMGNYEQSLLYLKKSMDFSLRTVGENHYQTATAYQNMAITHRFKKNYEQAIFYNKKASSIILKFFDKNHPKVANSNLVLGDIYLEMGKYPEALQCYTNNLKVNQNNLENVHPHIALSYEKIGNLEKELGNFDQALSYYFKSLTIHKNIYSSEVPISFFYNKIAEVYLQKKDYQKALNNYNEAITTITKGNSIPYLNKNEALISLEGKGKTLIKLYQKDKNIDRLKKAIITYQKADTLIGSIRQTLTNYQDKVTFAQNAREVYKGAIETELLLHKITKDPEHISKAFYHIEKSRANTLKELLRNANAKSFTGLPSNILDLEKELRINHAFYQSSITKEQSKANVDTLRLRDYENRLFDINLRQDSLITFLEKEYPKYYQLKHQKSTISIKEIQQQLTDQASLLEFFTTSNTTYTFVISKNDIVVKTLTTPHLEQKIESFRNAIITKNTQEYKTIGYELYYQLISPVSDLFKGDELIIIPDGPLWHLNFELLLTKKEVSNNPKQFSYLLKDYAITYVNAANLLFSKLSQNETAAPLQECLAFSFSDSTQTTSTNIISLATLRGTDDDLPGTRQEIRAIADIIEGQYFYGAEAIEANFKKNASTYNILHLALHGELDHERPENSRLYFTKSKDTIEDDLLYSHELFALNIPAELTVLSACNTGSGKIATGEGIMSLGSAFQYAGTKSLLLNSWDVSDQTTPDLMKYFYTHLKAGMSKAKALQQAKLQYLNTANINRTDPFYWGAFYLVGDSTPMHFSQNTIWYWGLGIGILLIIFFGLWLKRKKSHPAS